MNKFISSLLFLLIGTAPLLCQNQQWTHDQFWKKHKELKANGSKISTDSLIQSVTKVMAHGIEAYPNLHVKYISLLFDYYADKADHDKMTHYAEAMKVVLLENDLEEDLWKYYLCVGNIYSINGDKKSSKFYRLKVIKGLREKIPTLDEAEIKWHKGQLSGQLINLGYTYSITNQLDSAKLIYEEAMRLADENRNLHNVNKIKNSLGHMAYSSGDYASAATYYLESYTYFKEAKKSKDLIYCSAYMGRLYLALGQYEKGIKYYNELIEDAKEYNLLRVLPTAYLIKAEALNWLNRNEAAQISLNEYFQDSTLVSTTTLDCYAKLIQANIDLEVKERSSSIKAMRKFMNDCATLPHVEGETDELLDSYLGIASFQYKEGNVKGALDTIDMALSSSMRLRTKIEMLTLKSTIHKNEKNYRKALESNDKLNVLKDSMLTLNKIGIFLTEEANKKAAEKQIEIEKLEAEKKMISLQDQDKRNVIYALLSALFLMGGLSWFYSRHRKEKMEKELIDVKQHLLRQQINPHFIFNTLNSIQSSLLLEDEEKTLNLFNKFSNLIRQVLQNSTRAFIPLDEELSLLENYLALEKVRTNNKFDYEIEIEEGLDTSIEEVPSMVLQIFLENSIWHGIIPKKESGWIKIKVYREDGQLLINIEDNGVGLQYAAINKKSHQHAKKSLGTKLVKQRLNLLNKKFGKKIGLNILKRDQGAGTKVELLV